MWVMWWYLVVLKRRNPEVSKLNFLWSWIMDPSFSKMVTSTVSGNLNYDDFSISTVYSLSEQLQVFQDASFGCFCLARPIVICHEFSGGSLFLHYPTPWSASCGNCRLHPHLSTPNSRKLQRNFTEKKNETCFATNICGKCFATTFVNEISRTQEEHQDKKVRLKSARISYTSFRCKWIISG